jgi:dihydroorotate dehydrogenase electron transfer subunit
MMRDEIVTILENNNINEKYYKLSFRSPSLIRGARPGQFVNILIDPAVFLRRPFSYYRLSGSRVEILYEVLGRGTGILSQKKKGDQLTVMGPLGKSFAPKIKGRKRILVAGGIGLPPLVFVAETFGAEALLIGSRPSGEVLPKKELSGMKGKAFYSTNDGSYGIKGNVTDLLEPRLMKNRPENLFIQTCGPKAMIQAVLEMARRYGVEGEASLDKTMACGVGACLGCMVRTKRGLVPSCTEGPVFRFDELEEPL